jgi:electron transfer flavoprotein alpha subunit
LASILVLISGGTDQGLNTPAKEALGIAVEVADKLGATVNAALTESNAIAIDELAEYGVTRIYTSAGGVCPDVLGFAVRIANESAAQIVVVCRGPDLLQVVPRMAERLGGSCVMQVTGIDVVGDDIRATAAIYGGAARGNYQFHGDGPRIVALAPVQATPPARVEGRSADVVELDVPADSRVRVVRRAQQSNESRLEDARVVVSGGRGLRNGENYGMIRELAALLGGMPGASRAIVDDSWAKPAEQVGLTGKIVTPELYFAIGISGASQHMAGCANARTLVAINIDPGAPIFRYARYGVVGDCLEVLPELIRQTKARVG